MATKKLGSSSSLQNALALLRSKKVESHVVPLDPSHQKQSLPHIPTGSLILDYLIGGRLNEYGVPPCPGYPKGRIINLYGKEASGKTTLALTACAQVIKSGGTAAYIDWEHEVEIHYAKKLGVPVYNEDQFALIQPDTLEDGFKVIIALIMSGVDLIVLDSVGAGMTNVQLAQTLSDEGSDIRMGLVASRWSQFLPKMKTLISKTGTCIIGISQIRDKIGGMGHGDQITVVGGNAWKFYPSVRIYLRPAGKEKMKVFNPITNAMEEQPGGMKVKARLDKCKVSDSAHHEMELYMKSGSGVDDDRSLVEMGLAHKFVKKGGAWYEWILPSGEAVKAQGVNKLIEGMHATPNYRDIMIQQLQASLAKNVVLDSTMVDDDDDILQDDAGDQSMDDILSEIDTAAAGPVASSDDFDPLGD
jgi:recombination protein RecA